MIAQAALDKAIADVAAADAAAAATLAASLAAAQAEEARLLGIAQTEAAAAAARVAAVELVRAAAAAEAAKSIGYEHNYTGAQISMDASNPNVGGAFNDRLSTMKVGTGKWVRIFKNDQYAGANRTFFAGKTGVNPMNDQMTSFQAGTGTHPADTLVNGNAVKCLVNDVGKGQGRAVYRADGQTRVLRHYPNKGIAGSWDGNWSSKFIEIDCQGFSLGADMPRNPDAAVPSGSSSSNNPSGQ